MQKERKHANAWHPACWLNKGDKALQRIIANNAISGTSTTAAAPS